MDNRKLGKTPEEILAEAEALDPTQPDPDKEEEETLEDQDTPDLENLDPSQDEEDQENLDDSDEDEKEEDSPSDQPKPIDQPKPGEKKDPDFKNLYINSTKEALIQSSKNKKYNEAVKKAAELPEPTEAEVKEAYPRIDWDSVDDTTRIVLSENLQNKRRFDIVNQASLETSREQEQLEVWQGKVSEFVGKEFNKFPQLKGKEQEFAQFATRPSRVGADLDDVVKAFLFDLKPTKQHKGTLLLSGQNGEGGKPLSQKKDLNETDSAYLRTHNQREWQRLVKAGKIKIEI